MSLVIITVKKEMHIDLTCKLRQKLIGEHVPEK